MLKETNLEEEILDDQLLYEYDTMDMTEREVYEATCREGKPYVSKQH